LYKVLFFLLLFTFCSGIVLPDKYPVPESNRMKKGHAPTPFSAEEIRETCQTSTIKYLLEMKGREDTYQITEFINISKTGSYFNTTTTDKNGKVLSRRRKNYAKWTDLQEHASFPEENTTITTDKIKLEPGEFECFVYTVKTGDSLNKYYFAKELPGPPVYYEKFQKGESVFRMTLVSNSALHKEQDKKVK
ncbi:MAG: hypothetical protein KAR14_07820, partial [Candidatus Aminicenantes bacterium]|nr:hypothetical protein [Candidatus Aminicenantes bacterium]